MRSTKLNVRDLTITVEGPDKKPFPIVDKVSFDVEPGQVIALIGESGSGKTTVSLACMGYARPGCTIAGGEVLLGGRDILRLDRDEKRSLRGDRVSYIAQSAAAAFNSTMTIGAQVTEMAVLRGMATQAEADAAATALYRRLELPNPETIGARYPHQVSGGQLQRLMAAMAMLSEPDLLILDEPTTALDVTTQIEVLHAFKTLVQEGGNTAIYVTHDLALVAQIADAILVLKDGAMVEYGRTEQIITAPEHDYTKALLAAAHIMPASVETGKAPDAEALISVRGVSAGYGAKQPVKVLHDIDIDLYAGETLGLIGESGSGKTTLGRLISGLMAPLSGSVAMQGAPLPPLVADRSKAELRRVQFVFQQADVALNPRQTIGKILARPVSFFSGVGRSEARGRAAELLDRVGLPAAFIDRYPPQLSGGQRQRVNLARALAADPEVLICDEVTSALDTVVAQQILDLLDELQRDLGLSYIFITHDLATVAKICDRVAVMNGGRIVDMGVTAEVLSAPFHPYTELLLRSVPEMRIDWLEAAVGERRRLVADLKAQDLAVND